MKNENYNLTSTLSLDGLKARRLMLRRELNFLYSQLQGGNGTPKMKARYRRLFQAELDTDIRLWRACNPIDLSEADEIISRLESCR